jgi:tyrosine-protein phosphatase YwqE
MFLTFASMFGKKKYALPDFSAIGTDLHSHLLPGIDDGASTLEDALQMIGMMRELGYRKWITTPHVIATLYPNTKERILGQMYAIRETLEEEKRGRGEEDFEAETFRASAEYHLDSGFLELVERDELIPFGDKNYILIEFSFRRYPEDLDRVLEVLDDKGYTPILAHPERFGYLAMQFSKYHELKEKGLLFQMNLNSLSGHYGFPIKMTAEKLIDAGFVDVVGSDAHHPGQIRDMARVLGNKHFIKLVESGRLLNPGL